jgi:hypothetical protein
VRSRGELENRGSSRSENFSECVKLSEFSSKMVWCIKKWSEKEEHLEFIVEIVLNYVFWLLLQCLHFVRKLFSMHHYPNILN